MVATEPRQMPHVAKPVSRYDDSVWDGRPFSEPPCRIFANQGLALAIPREVPSLNQPRPTRHSSSDTIRYCGAEAGVRVFFYLEDRPICSVKCSECRRRQAISRRRRMLVLTIFCSLIRVPRGWRERSSSPSGPRPNGDRSTYSRSSVRLGAGA